MRFLAQQWQKLSITIKFILAFGVLLALIILVALTSYGAITSISSQSETAIDTSLEIQRLILKMDAQLQRARRLERDFFLRWPSLGFAKAHERYALESSKNIEEVVALSQALQEIITESNVSKDLRENDVNLRFYLSAAHRYDDTFKEAVDLVAQLATDETGLQPRLAQHSALLEAVLLEANDPDLIVLYWEVRSLEQAYLLNRQRPYMQSAFNVINTLREGIEQTDGFEDEQRNLALAYVNHYLEIAEEILRLDVAIRSKFNEFDIQAEAIDPISEDLINLANAEVARTRQQIAIANQVARISLVSMVVASVVLAVIIGIVLNNSLTQNIVKLTQTARDFQSGNLEALSYIKSTDELGQLSNSFNMMATRINTLITNLEQKVAERTIELETANQNLQSLNERLQYELNLARHIQQSLLPPSKPAWKGLDVVCYSTPAQEVGGDLYAYHVLNLAPELLENTDLPKKYAIMIGDVSGKGMPAALLMAVSLTLFRAIVEQAFAPSELLSLLDSALVDYTHMTRQNCALVYLEATQILSETIPANVAHNIQSPQEDGSSYRLRMANAGCVPPIIKRANGKVEWVDIGGTPLGIGLSAELGYTEVKIYLHKGDMIILTSDGTIEAWNTTQEMFGFARFEEAVATGPLSSVDAMLSHLRTAIDTFVEGTVLHDDLTLVVIQI